MHLRPGLGPEVLDDHFLDVAVAGVQVADDKEGIDPLGAGLADANEDATRKRHLTVAGGFKRRNARGRMFVGGAVVGLALFHEPL